MNYWLLLLLIYKSHLTGVIYGTDESPLERIRRKSHNKHKQNARQQKK
jgi:hypothetical protein